MLRMFDHDLWCWVEDELNPEMGRVRVDLPVSCYAILCLKFLDFRLFSCPCFLFIVCFQRNYKVLPHESRRFFPSFLSTLKRESIFFLYTTLKCSTNKQLFNVRLGDYSARIGRAASLRQDVASNQTRISAGSFTIYPGFGTILPGGVQNITVDCIAENMEKSEEVNV